MICWYWLSFSLICFFLRGFLQDTESALLEQALAMSMDDPRPSQSGGMGDADMSDATMEDEDLALGENLY